MNNTDSTSFQSILAGVKRLREQGGEAEEDFHNSKPRVTVREAEHSKPLRRNEVINSFNQQRLTNHGDDATAPTEAPVRISSIGKSVLVNTSQNCIDDIKSISAPENKQQQIMIPASASLYIPGKITENKKFIVDIGTGYYVEKTDKEAISFYEQKIQKLNKESVQIQNIIKEKTTASLAIEAHIRQIAASQHEERVRQQSQQNDAK